MSKTDAALIAEMKRKGRKHIGWWEEYACGCVSEIVKRKRDLVGYCGVHGHDKINVYPDFEQD